jgi:DNA-binding NarL/FixJ family response regulator
MFNLSEPAVFGTEALSKTATDVPATHTEGFGCVYITSSVPDAERAAVLLRQSQIQIYQARSLTEAESLMRRTRCRVLLADIAFSDGDWKGALETVWRLCPRIALVVASRSVDEALWISVLERGAYDLVQKPFRAEELRYILENAYAYSIRGGPPLFRASL